jgi:hypothetical protein
MDRLDGGITERISKSRRVYKRCAVEEDPDIESVGGVMERLQAV